MININDTQAMQNVRSDKLIANSKLFAIKFIPQKLIIIPDDGLANISAEINMPITVGNMQILNNSRYFIFILRINNIFTKLNIQKPTYMRILCARKIHATNMHDNINKRISLPRCFLFMRNKSLLSEIHYTRANCLQKLKIMAYNYKAFARILHCLYHLN